jgi:hypothetical protein
MLHEKQKGVGSPDPFLFSRAAGDAMQDEISRHR